MSLCCSFFTLSILFNAFSLYAGSLLVNGLYCHHKKLANKPNTAQDGFPEQQAENNCSKIEW